MKNLYHFRDIQKLERGDWVMIFGISGKDQSQVVQLARYYGAEHKTDETDGVHKAFPIFHALRDAYSDEEGDLPRGCKLIFSSENFWYVPVRTLADRLDDSIFDYIKENMQ